MKFTPRQYATLLYELTHDAKKAEIATRIEQFVRWLIVRRGTVLIPRIIAAFKEIWNEKEGIVHVEVVTAKKISAAEQKKIMNAFGKQTVELEETVEPNLLGGIKLKIGDTVIDGSIKAQLKALEAALTS